MVHVVFRTMSIDTARYALLFLLAPVGIHARIIAAARATSVAGQMRAIYIRRR